MTDVQFHKRGDLYEVRVSGKRNHQIIAKFVAVLMEMGDDIGSLSFGFGVMNAADCRPKPKENLSTHVS